ncbi:MAG: hypothetical protein UR28_C0019G0026 [Candidatus Peregrinibacteria bacterium GW2011_GWF2_33_10]|nr:MAG: hypothetical protein UR28_C0019G0026 [Candidatus Peregrinibacteria bacterium GW2011_GWF2_33_10]OGJ43989.1 MAG: tRNA 2-thiouridine(34) synthase MnmA [Candidatus Peregrinibacteria bacterium RIFOXYA12_FULL_33_12]OGJ45513.1 MAG: tRNA 2-thiouridine(34) synthase MnmA [Candidatus Peregrinibacteria bacterium RIFOXYA2_FULL_33_21]OGJ50012.1 MAG: tRNA 2-thiouridine(34) synthase MnmA [Candidatus Peregrinibacteria bacterium RIFOXYB2_FULL_33_20]
MKIAVLTSGGVDSSVALKLLQEQGHEVKAFYLKIWLEDELQYLGDCPWEEDLFYLEKVCDDLKVPLEIVPMQKEYFDKIVNYTIAEVKQGRTPNPDVMCNNHIKFGAFLEKLEADDQDFDKIASGHYAQNFAKHGIYYLKKSPDPVKDQTYFLCNLWQKQLAKILFPIGHLTKAELRELARKFNLPNQDRKDSQGLCFLGKFKFKEFLKAHLGEKPGDFIEFETGKKISKHKGYWFYTIGQRDGLGLSGGPWYVVKKDIEKNIIFISGSYHSEDKKRNEFYVSDLNWFEGQSPEKKNLEVKLRHGPKTYRCSIGSVILEGEGSERAQLFTKTDSIQVRIDGNDQGIAAGQFAVFYDGEVCLGGGIVKNIGDKF